MREKSSQEHSGWRAALVAAACALALACSKPEPLTAQKAEEIVDASRFKAEPVYAEVPQRVWWNARYPKDDFDERSLKTFENLKNAGLITVTDTSANGTTAYTAKVTPKGFPLLGTAPSLRGPVYRGHICYKVYDGVRNFVRHPTDPLVGKADLVWHYDRPTPLYPMFETKTKKELRKPYASMVSFYYKSHEWHFDVTVKKTEP